MGIFSRLFNRGHEDGSGRGDEQLEGDAASLEQGKEADADADADRISIAEPMEIEPPRAAKPPPPPRRGASPPTPKAAAPLDPLDPADFEVRTKSGRKRLLSVPDASVPPSALPAAELEEVDAPPPVTVPKMAPLALDVDELFGVDSKTAPDAPEAPAAAEVPAEVAPDAGDDFDFDAELERGFAASLRRTSRPAPADGSGPVADSVTTEADLDQLRDLFHDMAAHYVGQVRDFMLELRRAEAATIWIPLCEPVVQRLRSMCETLAMPEVSRLLEDFASALARAKSSPTGVVQGVERDELLAAYDRLITLLPRAFELGDTGREALIVELLLLQIPGVRHLTLERLYRAGLHQFEAFHQANPGELAAVAGIEVPLAEQIVQRFRDYRQTVTGVLADPAPALERSHLHQLVVQLREQQDAYEAASARWSDDAIAEKRRLRRARLETLSHVYVALARLGEVDRISRMKKMGVEWQLEELAAYLREFPNEAPAG